MKPYLKKSAVSIDQTVMEEHSVLGPPAQEHLGSVRGAQVVNK